MTPQARAELRSRERDEGLASIVLVIVIAWALTATGLLVGTWITTRQIDERVGTITSHTASIDQDLDLVRLADRTDEIAADIRQEAEPLSEQLRTVRQHVTGINRHAASILDDARSIDRTVGSIRERATAINATADRLDGHFAAVLDVARSIDQGVEGINLRAGDVIGLATGIREDLDDVLAHVGPGHGQPTDRTLHGHAHSIMCSPPLVAFNAEHCA